MVGAARPIHPPGPASFRHVEVAVASPAEGARAPHSAAQHDALCHGRATLKKRGFFPAAAEPHRRMPSAVLTSTGACPSSSINIPCRPPAIFFFLVFSPHPHSGLMRN
jgi:hypothetical protein